MSGTKFTISTKLPETHDAAGYEKLKFMGVSEATNSQLLAKITALEASNAEMCAMLEKYVELVSDDRSDDFLLEFQDIKAILAKARGES